MLSRDTLFLAMHCTMRRDLAIRFGMLWLPAKCWEQVDRWIGNSVAGNITNTVGIV